MATAFYTALSGLSANMRSLTVIGHNLANMNTVGYKGSLISFQDLVARGSLAFNGAGNPSTEGIGVTTAGIATNFTQGSLQRTGQPLDVAIVGTGFMVVNAGGQQLYTRAGNLSLDSEGALTTQQGAAVLGFPIDAAGAIDRANGVSALRIDLGASLPARESSLLRFATNLDSEMLPGEVFSTTVQVVDSLGAQHTVTFEFTRNAPVAPGDPPSYSFDILMPGDEVAGGTAGTPFSLLTGADQAAPPGTADFASDGTLASVDPGTGPLNPPTDFTFAVPGYINGAGAQTVNVDLVDDLGEARMTAYAAPSSTTGTFQDGTPSANLITFSVDPDGIIQGVYSNGETAALGQLAIAVFNNPQGLVRLGENLWGPGVNAGDAAIGTGGSGGRGSISGGTLELSNVDIADEFTKLIVAQRGYQANARVVTTTDEVTQEAINLKR